MNATLVIFFLTVQSSYSADVESPATLDTFDHGGWGIPLTQEQCRLWRQAQ
jgi:hypothetical protein